jgi:hypothetical protein
MVRAPHSETNHNNNSKNLSSLKFHWLSVRRPLTSSINLESLRRLFSTWMKVAKRENLDLTRETLPPSRRDELWMSNNDTNSLVVIIAITLY